MPGTSQAHSMASDDPFDEILKPPPNESPEAFALRVQKEEQARQISLAIDANIKAERQARKKKRIVRLLLLGQSESGKSTTLRQFQRLYTPTAFREERVLWRAIIQLNIVRSIRIILEALEHPSSPQISPHVSPKSHYRNLSDNARKHRRASNANPIASTSTDNSMYDEYFMNGSNGHHNGHISPESDPDSDSLEMYGQSTSLLNNLASLEALKMRLLPLRHIEALLVAKLVPPNEDEATQLPGQSQNNGFSHNSTSGNAYRNQEVFVRPGTTWKGALARARVHYPSAATSISREDSDQSGNVRPLSAGNLGSETADEPQEVLNSCRMDMMQLWADSGVRSLLHRRKIRLEEYPGFFLNDLERVTSLKYMPTDDDVLKARLKTVGVAEYRFEMEVSTGRETGTDWRIVDVGGSRKTWVPFFDDVDAIIFLAPISAFDQVLTEDRSVNRLEDSVLLWKSVCSNKLLANVDLVLFLNKCDILEAKLKSGIKLSRYVRTYGDRPNDMENVSKYLRGKFSAIHREYSPNPRKFYAFCTSVTDTATTAGIIASVRDMVIRQHLKQSKLM
ncbi:G-alpha-domain-containing protein [Dendrothele bispora CBS 962.96]|uniref:G-alpha-domain-containing protein n=1 Tax=Dendrothele bispora (strain CBS 962.96) TaxID=1314807 RepID=A0A4S8MWS6_DENBC|nr:G-alpha-domain-containing protein [Dendrothele bispora CBS 962.96]